VSRSFDGSGDSITFSAGGAAAITNAAFTIAILWSPAITHAGGLIDGRDGGSARHLGVNPFSDDNVYVAVGADFRPTSYAAYIGDWAVLAFTKGAGSSLIRTHLYDYGVGSWVHANLASAVGADAATLATILVGPFDGAQDLNGNLAAMGFWTGTALADASFEAGSGFQTSLANWFNLTPSVLWRFDQASIAIPVTDLMSSGADQTAISGTSVSANDPPGFSYSISTTVSGTAVADLGALSAAASGSVTHPGTAIADLGALSAAATGGVTVSGTALSDLGSLNATATGTVVGIVTGVALADLGRLNALADTQPPDPDQFVSLLMNKLLECLCTYSQAAEGAPAHCCFRVGTEIAHDAGMLEDLCCEGIAYVALGETYPSSESFPEADIVRQAAATCAPATWAQTFQVGIIRCAPVGNGFLPPGCTDWNAAARQNIIDARTLRQVACCIREYVVNGDDSLLGMSLVIDRQLQGNPQGGCVERTMKITAQFPNNDCGC
jgi:hypothetical protein